MQLFPTCHAFVYRFAGADSKLYRIVLCTIDPTLGIPFAHLLSKHNEQWPKRQKEALSIKIKFSNFYPVNCLINETPHNYSPFLIAELMNYF